MKLTRDALRRTTAPALLCERARTMPDTVAFLSKRAGAYEERTWLDYACLVARCAKSFAGLGVKAGRRVAILARAREEAAICDLAAQALGAVVCGIDPAASAEEFAQCMKEDVALVIAETQDQIDRLQPRVDSIVFDDPASYPGLIGNGTGTLAWLEHQVRLLLADAPAFIEDGVVVSHGAHLAATLALIETYQTLGKRTHRTVAHLPPSRGLGRGVAITLPLLSSLVPCYADDLATALIETRPTVLFSGPCDLQACAARILVCLGDRAPLRRWLYAAALGLSRRYVRERWRHRVSFSTMTLQSLAHAAVFRPLLRQVGFEALELVICGGEPLPEETVALWHMYGVNLVAVDLQTGAAQRGPFPRPGDLESWSRAA